MLVSRTVRIKAVFRPGDGDAVTVLRLLAAANDLFTLSRLLPGMRGAPEETPSQKAIAAAERRYVFRMSVLHCTEIIDLVNHADFNHAVERCARRGGRFENLTDDAASLRKKINGPVRQVIEHFRNRFGGHYDRELFAQALTLLDGGDLMDLPGGVKFDYIHFNVTDRLFDVALIDKSHGHYRAADEEKSVEKAMNQVFDVMQDLMNVAVGMTWALFYEGIRG